MAQPLDGKIASALRPRSTPRCSRSADVTPSPNRLLRAPWWLSMGTLGHPIAGFEVGEPLHSDGYWLVPRLPMAHIAPSSHNILSRFSEIPGNPPGSVDKQALSHRL